MKEPNHLRKLLIASVVIVLGVPAIASATPHTNDAGERVIQVSYADLNLSSEAGLDVLYKRLQGASSAACGPQHSMRSAGSLRQLVENRACYDDLLSKLVEKVNNARLNEIHAG